MRPHPLVPSPRRTLATLAALLISAALSLGFAPLSSNLVPDTAGSALKLAGEPCDLEKISTAVAVDSTVSTADPVVSPVRSAVSAADAVVPTVEAISAVEPKLSTASPVGLAQSCSGVRPGAALRTDDGGLCTFNFVFRHANIRYIGSAGHCVLETPQVFVPGQLPRVERTWAPGTGPIARDAEGNRIGVFVYGLRELPQDFALIRLDDGVPVDPAMCHFGGPTGINAELVEESVVLHYYGNGLLISAVAPGRTGLAPNMSDPTQVAAHGVVIPGDSGAGVIDSNGRAIGNISTAGIGPAEILEGTLTIPRIAPQLARAEQVLGIDLELVTAPLQ